MPKNIAILLSMLISHLSIRMSSVPPNMVAIRTKDIEVIESVKLYFLYKHINRTYDL